MNAAVTPAAKKANVTKKADTAEAPKAAPTDVVKVRLQDGTREHGTKLSNGELRWLINPSFKGRERWFDRTKINGSGMDKKGYFVMVTRKEAEQRGMAEFIEA